MNNTAIVIGATGLIGLSLVKQLLESEGFSSVKVFTRRSLGIDHQKLEEHLVDFDETEQWKHLLTGDMLFSSMGTTLKKAGSKETQYKIDYTYQFNVAGIAAENGVSTYCLVSSAGANPKSSVFYSRMKGELDEAVKHLPFKNIGIFRPSILAGERNENRTGERIGLALAGLFTKLPGLKKYRPIQGATVAKAMINMAQSAKNKPDYAVYTFDEIFKLAE